MSNFTETHIAITGPGIDLLLVSTELGHHEAGDLLSPLVALLRTQQDQRTASPIVMSSLADEIAKLSDLKMQGIISDEEFDQLKAKIISGT